MHEKLLESKVTFPKAPISDDLKSLKVCRCPPASVSGSFTYTQLLFDQRVKNNIGPLFLYNIYNISRVRRAAIMTACSSLTPAGWNECEAHVCTLEFRHDCLDSDFPDTVETIWSRKNWWDLGKKKIFSSMRASLENSADHSQAALKQPCGQRLYIMWMRFLWNERCVDWKLLPEQISPQNHFVGVIVVLYFLLIHLISPLNQAKKETIVDWWGIHCSGDSMRLGRGGTADTQCLWIWLTINSMDKQ